jgi:hypothetical protein
MSLFLEFLVDGGDLGFDLLFNVLYRVCELAFVEFKSFLKIFLLLLNDFLKLFNYF